jgi:hypothetical protein
LVLKIGWTSFANDTDGRPPQPAAAINPKVLTAITTTAAI